MLLEIDFLDVLGGQKCIPKELKTLSDHKWIAIMVSLPQREKSAKVEKSSQDPL